MESKIYKANSEEESTYGSLNGTSSNISSISIDMPLKEHELKQYPALSQTLSKTFTDSKANINQIYQILKNYGLLRYYTHIANDDNVYPSRPLDLGRATKVKELMDEIVADKIYPIPKSMSHRAIIPYKECSPEYDYQPILNDVKYPWVSPHSNQIIYTATEATKILRPLRGKIVRYDIILLILVAAVLPLISIVAILCGVYMSYWITLGLLVALALLIALFLAITKIRSRSFLKWSSVCLAFFLRVENDRYYIKHGLLLRPGSLGKWIELTPVKLK
jgi:hypothetical protein